MTATYSAKNEALGRDLASIYWHAGSITCESDDFKVKVFEGSPDEGVKVYATSYGKQDIFICWDYTENYSNRPQDSNLAAQIVRATIDALRALGY